jgi:hypothetical protein
MRSSEVVCLAFPKITAAMTIQATSQPANYSGRASEILVLVMSFMCLKMHWNRQFNIHSHLQEDPCFFSR